MVIASACARRQISSLRKSRMLHFVAVSDVVQHYNNAPPSHSLSMQQAHSLQLHARLLELALTVNAVMPICRAESKTANYLAVLASRRASPIAAKRDAPQSRRLPA